MLIPYAATPYARDAEEWHALMVFLKDNDCLIGNMRRDPRGSLFDPRNNAVRIEGDRFWKGHVDIYLDCGPSKYGADPIWWCIPGYEFINMHQPNDTQDDCFDISVLESIL